MAFDHHQVDRLAELVRRAAKFLPTSTGETRRLTHVEPDPDGEAGWFTVAGRLKPGQVDGISDGTLRHGQGQHAVVYDVLEVLVDGEVTQVRASITAPRSRLELHVPVVNQERILTGLSDGLTAVRSNPLLQAFQHHSLSPIVTDKNLATIHGGSQLNTSQKWGAAACCSPGLQLIWGPPGTGKTHVIAASIAHLATSGRRILLVSSTNIAVDTALNQAVRIMQSEPGQAVRLGTIHLPELARDKRVNLERLTEARQAALHRRLDEIKADLDALAVSNEKLQLIRSQLTGFDATAYQQAVHRTENRAEFERQESALPGAQAEYDRSNLELVHLQHVRWAVARRDADVRESQVRSSLDSVTTELRTLEEQSWWARTRRHNDIERLRSTRSALVDEHARASAHVRQIQDAARQAGIVPTLAGEWDAAAVEQAEQAASRRAKSTGAAVAAIRRTMDHLVRQGLSDLSDQTRITEQRRLWDLHLTLPALEERAEQAKSQIAAATKQYEETQKRSRKGSEQFSKRSWLRLGYWEPR